MVNHPDSVTYDAFNCNSGKPHEPNTHWDASTNAWEWNDLKVNTGSTPGIFSDDVKEALENNICLICGKKTVHILKIAKITRNSLMLSKEVIRLRRKNLCHEIRTA